MRPSSKNPLSKARATARTPFERRRVEEIRAIYKDGLNPFEVVVHASGGSYAYTHSDIANYLEQTSVPYALTLSAHDLKEQTGKNKFIRTASSAAKQVMTLMVSK